MSLDQRPIAADVARGSERVDSGARRLLAVLRRPALAEGILLPVAVVIVALALGAVLLTIQSVPVLEAYSNVAFGSVRALTSTATAATPLILVALGVALAFRAGLITIGAEGQFLVGAVTAVAVVTAPTLAASVPGPLLLVIGLLVAAAAGAAWSMISALLNVRFGASVVITSLLLNYVAQALLAWGTRAGIPDPDAFTPQTRSVGEASLPTVPGTTLHIGFLLALVAAGIVWAALSRGRIGLRADVMGSSPDVLRANETDSGRYTYLLLGLAGLLAGVAGFVEVAGVTSRITGGFSGAVGFTAIMVALLGRLHPLGIVIASILMAALSVGFGAAGRSLRIPSTTAEILQALIILLFVVGAALLQRRRATR
jgi:ABC-type uncharacterized transport system permease subunit